jgi:hypothetical protein
MLVQVFCPNRRCGAPLSTSGLHLVRGARRQRCGQAAPPSISDRSTLLRAAFLIEEPRFSVPFVWARGIGTGRPR